MQVDDGTEAGFEGGYDLLLEAIVYVLPGEGVGDLQEEGAALEGNGDDAIEPCLPGGAVYRPPEVVQDFVPQG